MVHSIRCYARAVTQAMAVCGFGLLAFAATPDSASAQSFTVTAPNMVSYSIDGQPDPTLSLIRGRTYTFAINTPGHPFYIKTAQVTGTGSQFATGVTNNGATSGTLTFVVPASAPNQLFYQCSVHAAMTGLLQIADEASPVPAASPWTTMLLFGMLLALGSGVLWLSSSRGSRSSRTGVPPR